MRIALAGFGNSGQDVARRLVRGDLPGVPDLPAVARHLQLVGRLHDAPGVGAQLPAQPRLRHVDPQGVDLVLAAQARHRGRRARRRVLPDQRACSRVEAVHASVAIAHHHPRPVRREQHVGVEAGLRALP